MGNFKEHNRRGSYRAARGDNDRFSSRGEGGFSNRGGNRGGGFGGRSSGGFGGRKSFGDRNSGPKEMFDVTCSKCGKDCRVPFRPNGSKPVLCSDCFRQSGQGESSSRNFSPRSSEQSGITAEQYKQLNAKLDKILAILETVEIEVAGDEDEDSEDLDELDEDEEEDEE